MKKSVVAIVLFVSVQISQAQVTFEKNGQQIPRIAGRNVEIADFNEDGALDAVFGASNNLNFYFGDVQGQFTNSNTTLSVSALEIGDVNHDGHFDVIGGDKIWLNDGKGNFTSKNCITDNIADLELADLNGDGHPDIFAIVNYSASRAYFNDGDGNFTDSGQKLGDGTIGTGQIAELALGDINNDGAIDAITTGWRWDGSTQCPNQVWMNDGTGNFTLGNQNLDEGSSHVHGLILHDINGDGWLDLILSVQEVARSGRIYLNDQTGNFIKHANIGGGYGEDVELGDFNGDGIPDLFIAQSQQGSRVWLNDGQGNLTDGVVRLGSNNYWDSAVGDFNSDGKPDVFAVGFIWGTGNAAPVDIWLNTTEFPSGVKTGFNSLPEDFQLLQNFPNPFNPTTVIGYQLPEYGNVKLKVHDTLGRDIKTLVDSFQSPGEYSFSWNGHDDSGNQVSSGMYFYSFVIDDMQFHKKMMLVR
ncbi:VCBS repeat-containing protein [candidate division KSB1 bacterium]|nr:VCBS repeat-containing protein [candidate division KSB1 bacterium]